MIPYKSLQYNLALTISPQKLTAFSKLIIGLTGLFPKSDLRLKLVFYQNFLQFLKVVSLSLIQQNKLIERLKSGIPNENLSRIERSFYEMLFQYKVVLKMGNSYLLQNKYQNWTLNDWEAIHMLVHQHSIEKESSVHIQKLGIQFMFVTELIQLYRNKNRSLKHIKRIGKWQELISQGKLDYEIRLSETLLRLRDLKLPNKIKSPFDDAYYTESGRNAFNNFTKKRFQESLQIIQKQHIIHAVLDVGCGYGNYIDAANQLLPDAEIYGIELQEMVYSETKLRFNNNSKIHLFNQNIFDFTADIKFDLVLFNYVLFYFSDEDKLKLFHQLHGKLSHNGSILVCQYYAGIEVLKTKLAAKQGDAGAAKQVEQFFGNKILYANTLWNESSDAFVQSENWKEFKEILKKTGFEIISLTNADRFYYSLFVEIKKI